jgi:DegV family protein with EDD domain
MERIVLLTDSTCDVPPEVLAEKNIHMVPLSVLFGDEEYRDALDLNPDQFYAKLKAAPQLPTTSQPSIGVFLEMFQKIRQEGATHVLGLFITGKFSGTGQAASAAFKMVPGLKGEILDAKSASWGHGLLVLYAHQLIQSGVSFAEVLNLIQDRISKTMIYFAVDTLDALYQGGRIGRAAAFFGKHLGIRPLLSLPGLTGEIEVVGKVNSREAALAGMVKLACQHVQTRGLVFGIAVMHSAMPMMQRELLTALQGSGENWKTIVEGRIGAVIGTHLGPDGWGIALC